MDEPEGDPRGRAILELRPDPRTAFRYYLLLAVASTLGVAVCVILFAGATAGSLALLAIQIAMLEAAFHLGLAGVFYDFYLAEKAKSWTLSSAGIDLFRGGVRERSVRWSEVTRAYPRGASVCIETGRDAQPEKLFFIPAADRERFYRVYLYKMMYPFAKPPT